MKKSNLIFILISAMTLQAQSQIDSASFLDKTTFKIGYYGYFGNLLINNGLNVGAEYSWKEKEKVKEKKGGKRSLESNCYFMLTLVIRATSPPKRTMAYLLTLE